MNISVISLLFILTISHVASGVFWNGRSDSIRRRTRPPRHYSPTSYYNFHNRIFKPLMRLRKSPYFHSVKSHRGGPFVNNPAILHHHNPAKPFRRPVRVHHLPIETPRIPSPIEYQKIQTPLSNMIGNSVLSKESESNQYGYLSPTYSGWKPIARPYFGQYSPYSDGQEGTTEDYSRTTTRKQKPLINTLFRENVNHIRPLSGYKLKPEYSENQGVAVPYAVESATFPTSSTFPSERPTQSTFRPFEAVNSQSEERPVVKKHFSKFSPTRQRPPLPHDSNSGREVSTDSPQLLSKFKISRPKLKVKSHASFQRNEPETEEVGQDGLQKVTFSTNREKGENFPHYQEQPPSNLNPKLHKLRTRVKVKTRRPEGFVNADQLSHVHSYRPSGQTPGSHKEKNENSDLRQQPPNPTRRRPLRTYLGNETYDAVPFQQPPFPSDFSGSLFPSKFMDGLGSDEQRYQPPRPLPSVAVRENPGRKVVGAAGWKKSRARPFQYSGEPRRGHKRKQVKHQHKQKKTTIAHMLTGHFNNQKSPIPEELYIPPEFTQSSSLETQNPVSFMTMPNAQPKIIHHILNNQQQNSVHQHDAYRPSLKQTPEPYRTYHSGNGPIQPHSNNQGFRFMNTQNGQGQGAIPTRQEPLGPQHYGNAAANFYHYRPAYEAQENQKHHDGNSPLESNPAYSKYSTYASSTTPRNKYRFPIPNHPVQNYDFQQQQEQQRFSQPDGRGQTILHYQNPTVNLDAYASNEYERIPQEFMNDLRPILLKDEQLAHVAMPALSPTKPSQNSYDSDKTSSHHQDSFSPPSTFQRNAMESSPHHSFETTKQSSIYSNGIIEPSIQLDSPEVSKFMDEFFRADPRPFLQSQESSFGEPTKVYLISNDYHQNSMEKAVESNDNYKSAASNFRPHVMKHKFESVSLPFHKSVENTPIVSNFSLHESLIGTTVSPINDSATSSQRPVPSKWSKEKFKQNETFSKEAYEESSNNYMQVANKVNITTPKQGPEGSSPRLSELSSTKSDGNQLKGSYLNPSPLILKNLSFVSSEDGPSDSNAPESSKARNDPRIRIHQNRRRPTQRSKPSLAANYTPRGLRRRKPGILGRRKLVKKSKSKNDTQDLPVMTHQPRPALPRQASSVSKNDGDFESSRLSVKSKRERGVSPPSARLNVSTKLSEKRKGLATTPVSIDPNAVTYGESQWFQIKESPTKNGEELDYYPRHTGKKGSTDIILSSNPENQEGEKISFSSRILSATPHVKLESLWLDSGVKKSRNLSAKKFYSVEAQGTGKILKKEGEMGSD